VKDAKYALAKTLAGHGGRVEGVAWTADGRRVVTGSLDLTVKLWDAETGALVQSYDEHTKGIARVAASADGRSIASASWDHTARLWPLPKP
jgi:WD40 repeat protein